MSGERITDDYLSAVPEDAEDLEDAIADFAVLKEPDKGDIRDLFRVASQYDELTREDAIELAFEKTDYPKGALRGQMDEMAAEEARARLSFEWVEKIIPTNTEEDPTYRIAVTLDGETRTIKATGEDLVKSWRATERLFNHFGHAPNLGGKDEWRDTLNQLMANSDVRVKREEEWTASHRAAEDVLTTLETAEVWTDYDRWRADYRFTQPMPMFYDESEDVVLVRSALIEDEAADDADMGEVAQIFKDQNLLADTSKQIRGFDSERFRAWQFSPAGLIDKGVIRPEQLEGDEDEPR